MSPLTIPQVTGEAGRETTEFVTVLNTKEKDGRLVVSRVLEDEKDGAQLSSLEGEEYDYSFFVTNTERSAEEVVDSYENRGSFENYNKEAKYDMAVGHLLLQSFWVNEAIFQLMMLVYNLFLLFKMDFAGETEYQQQIKTFRLKWIFLAGKIFRTTRSVVMKLSEKHPYQEMYEKACRRNITLHVSIRCYDLNLPEQIRSDTRICESGSQTMMYTGGNDAKLKTRLSESSRLEMKTLVEFFRPGISV